MSVLDFPNARQINERAEKVDVGAGFKRFGQMLVALLAFVFAGIGWLAGFAIYAATWIWAAMAEGYTSGRHVGQHRATG